MDKRFAKGRDPNKEQGQMEGEWRNSETLKAHECDCGASIRPSVWSPTFCMSVMSTSLMTLFFFEEPDLELELSKHR